MKLTPHEQRILELVRANPEIVDNPKRRAEVAEQHGLTEKTLRNRIGDLKKYGMLPFSYKQITRNVKEDRDKINSIDKHNNLDQREINLLDLLHVMVLRRKTIIKISFSISLISIIISLLLPKWYHATAVIMPPSGNKELSLGSIASELPFGGFGIVGDDDESNIYLAILKSRTMAVAVINQFDLIKKYDVENMELAVEKLHENVWFLVSDERTISIDVISKDQNEVANMANYFVSELDFINKRLATERASNNRTFIESRVNETKQALRQSEEKLRDFQEKNGIIMMSTQIEATIRAAAEIKSQIFINEIEKTVLESSVNPENPELQNLNLTLTQLQKKFDALKYKNIFSSKDGLFQPLSDVPEIGLEYARLVSDAEIYSTILKYLIPEFEQAKIQESKDTPTIQILDSAVTPEEKHKPQRTFIVLLSSFIGFIFAVIIAFIEEFFSNVNSSNDNTSHKIKRIALELKSDFSIFNQRKKQ